MAIAMEFFNIIVPKAVIAAKYPGGVAQYEKDGGPTYLEDDALGTTPIVQAVEGPYYMAIPSSAAPETGKDLAIFVMGDNRPLVTLPNILALGAPQPPRDRAGFGNDKRVLFIPAAKAILTIPFTNDRIIVQRLDIEDGLKKSGQHYLYVASQPPNAVRRGTQFDYPMTVCSKEGRVKYKVDVGPEGLQVDPNGLVSWKVPEDARGLHTVVVSVGDSAGQEVYHIFKLYFVGPPGKAPTQMADDPMIKTPQSPARDPTQKKQEVRESAHESNVVTANVGSASIVPPQLAENRVVYNVPSTIGDVQVAGGGRFLVLSLPGLRKLGLFDVNAAKITGFIPLADDQAAFTAGSSHVVVGYPSVNMLQRWNLATLKREVSIVLPAIGSLNSLTMGANSTGPLLVGQKKYNGGMHEFYDVMTLQPLQLKIAGRVVQDVPECPRASADGCVFTFRTGPPSAGPGLLTVLRIQGSGATVQTKSLHYATVVPAADGSHLYAGTTVLNPALKVVHSAQAHQPFIPVLDGPYFLRLDPTDPTIGYGILSVFSQGTYDPFATLSNVVVVTGKRPLNHLNSDAFTTDKRVHGISRAKLIVTIPETDNMLILHRFDMESSLKKHRGKE